MKYAVATKDGISINEHFGHAKQFYIYEVAGNECSLLEKRQVEHYCLGQTSSKTAMATIIRAIEDCEAVLVAKIGEGPTTKLKAVNVVAVSDYAYEEIKESLISYAEHNQ